MSKQIGLVEALRNDKLLACDPVCLKAADAVEQLLNAATHAETVMSIVEPRSDKKEYLETLFELRAAITAATI